jgi:hypothetical protein
MSMVVECACDVVNSKKFVLGMGMGIIEKVHGNNMH